MTDISNLFLYLSLGLIILWTVRLARSKGRNPFVWGGTALLLMLVPSWPDLLAMGPMMVLLFLKSPQRTSQETLPETVTCPKCHAYHAAGHTYCVNCGWELGRAFSGNSRQNSEAVAAAAHVEPELAPASDQAAAPVEAPARHFAAEVAAPAFEPAVRPMDSVPAETVPEPGPEVQQPAAVRYPITPAGFTERGSALMAEGKFQIAIDQFTKAIALDPAYRPAWVRRAEAHRRLGREGKAREDRLHLDTLPG